MKSTFPTTGFDRFIDLSWADYALDLAITNSDSAHLKAWLEERIAGKESARKTANLLSNLWLTPHAATSDLRDDALHLASEIPHQQYIVLHWGMALASFPLFQHTVAYIGRLLRLQGSFRGHELVRRVSESYSNQGTIPRLVNRILQTLVAWNILEKQADGSYTAVAVLPLDSLTLHAWLFQASLIREQERDIAFDDLLRLPELFPFDTASYGRDALITSPKFNVFREGMNQEYAVLKLV